VASDKNMLGKAVLVFGLASSWQFIQELRRGYRRRNTLMVHGAILTMVIWLFWMANSMTSLSCFTLASALMAALTFWKATRKRALVHFMVASVVLTCGSVLFLNMGGGLLSAMGRNPTLTGRTDLWDKLFTMVVNPILGAGFESFWLGQRLEYLWSIYWWHPNEAHNGYLEVFLNLGWIGVILLLTIIFTGYRNVMQMLRQDPEAGRLRLAYLVVAVAYNFTEAAIRTMDLVWIAFILAVITLPKISVRNAKPTRTLFTEAVAPSPALADAQHQGVA